MFAVCVAPWAAFEFAPLEVLFYYMEDVLALHLLIVGYPLVLVQLLLLLCPLMLACNVIAPP